MRGSTRRACLIAGICLCRSRPSRRGRRSFKRALIAETEAATHPQPKGTTLSDPVSIVSRSNSSTAARPTLNLQFTPCKTHSTSKPSPPITTTTTRSTPTRSRTPPSLTCNPQRQSTTSAILAGSSSSTKMATTGTYCSNVVSS